MEMRPGLDRPVAGIRDTDAHGLSADIQFDVAWRYEQFTWDHGFSVDDSIREWGHAR